MNNLLRINGIGNKNAENVLNNKDKFIDYYNQLKKKSDEYGIKLVDLRIKNEVKETKGIFKNKIIVMSGFRDKEIEEFDEYFIYLIVEKLNVDKTFIDNFLAFFL